jgi:ubiquinol-cytochrome c reductase cytochrome b subunit
MRLLKTHPILGLVNSYMVDSPQPASISYMWNFGSLLGACLVIQIITGITLAMHYTPNMLERLHPQRSWVSFRSYIPG